MGDFLDHLDQGFHRVEGLAGSRIQVDDDVDVGTVSHIFDELEGSLGVHPETQPHMGRHQQDPVSAGFFGILGHFDGTFGVFTVDPGDDGHHIAAFFGADFRYPFPFFPGQTGDFASVAVADQTFDAFVVEGFDPAQVCSEFRFVDGIVSVQRNGYRRENGLEVLEEVCPLSARIVVNQVSMKMENERITKLINDIKNYLENK